MSSNEKINLVIRKNKGKQIIDKYYDMFIQAGFAVGELDHVDLKRSDELINAIKTIFSVVKPQKVEIISGESNYKHSILLNSMLGKDKRKNSYIFSDDVSYCGMYVVNNNSILKNCLNVAKYGYSNTCFILDESLKFSLTINYYNESNTEMKNQFDIQLKPCCA